MDPKKKNMIYISVAVVAMGYAGYSLLFSGESAKAQTQTGNFKKKTHTPAASLDAKSVKKRPATGNNARNATSVKKQAPARQNHTIKRKPGRRSDTKTKKKVIVPDA